MIERVYDFMCENRMISPGARILAAVSGGADSMCLLEILRRIRHRLPFEICVLHVHHGLRERAEEDLTYVSDYCREAGIPFQAVRVDAGGYALKHGLSIEEGARILRYQALEESAREWDEREPGADPCRIAVAHHMEDQAETVLFHLVRGSRLTGLRGMLPVNGRIIRPLLTCRREEIEAFLKKRGIRWREDETNEDTRYARNLLRKEVMPLLNRINSGACEHISRAAEEAAQTEEYLREKTQEVIRRCKIKEAPGEVVFDISKLLKEPALLQRRAVYELIAEVSGTRKDLQDVHVQSVLHIARAGGSAKADLPGGCEAVKVYDQLRICKAGRAPKAPLPLPAGAGEYSCRVLDFDGDMGAVPRNLYTKWLDYDKIGSLPLFRTRRTGDRLTLDGDGRSKTIARYMIDAKVPKDMREQVVLPAVGSEILWFPGGRISARFMVEPSTKRVLEITWKPGTGK